MTPRVRTGTVRPLARVWARRRGDVPRSERGERGGTRETRRRRARFGTRGGAFRVGAGAGAGRRQGSKTRGGDFAGLDAETDPPGKVDIPPGKVDIPPGKVDIPRAADPASKAGALRGPRVAPLPAPPRHGPGPGFDRGVRSPRGVPRWPPPIRIARMFHLTCSLPRSRRSGRFDARSRRGGNRRSPARENREKCGRHSSPRPATTGTGTGFGTESTPRIATSSIGEAAAARGRAGRTKAAAPRTTRARCAANIYLGRRRRGEPPVDGPPRNDDARWNTETHKTKTVAWIPSARRLIYEPRVFHRVRPRALAAQTSV